MLEKHVLRAGSNQQGNVESSSSMLKSIEGVGSFAGSALKGMFKKNLLTKLAALLVMPGLNAFNFLLEHSLGGGGVASLRIDPQGKAFAQQLLEFPVPVSRAVMEKGHRT